RVCNGDGTDVQRNSNATGTDRLATTWLIPRIRQARTWFSLRAPRIMWSLLWLFFHLIRFTAISIQGNPEVEFQRYF
ncbi:MAG: hypothetical protein NT154_30285, partial [Verrucomicrobia bacterium]|nr:hypothetical protein [Verrucomicrobiota bacterium]